MKGMEERTKGEREEKKKKAWRESGEGGKRIKNREWKVKRWREGRRAREVMEEKRENEW